MAESVGGGGVDRLFWVGAIYRADPSNRMPETPFISGRMTILAGIEGQETGSIVPVFVASVGNGPSAGHECAKVSADIAIGQFSKRTGEVSSRRGDRVNA